MNIMKSSKGPASVQEARAVQAVQREIRVNRTPINSFGAVATMTGRRSMNSPVNYITYTLTNASGGPLTYVIGDPFGLVAGAFGATWTQPTSVRGGSVAAVQDSFSTQPVAITGFNYVVNNAAQFTELVRYVGASQDGRIYGEPINIDATLRNNQYVATRQTVQFEQDYALDTDHAFTFAVPDTFSATITLYVGANLR